jgi:hypothetical protein
MSAALAAGKKSPIEGTNQPIKTVNNNEKPNTNRVVLIDPAF